MIGQLMPVNFLIQDGVHFDVCVRAYVFTFIVVVIVHLLLFFLLLIFFVSSRLNSLGLIKHINYV